MRRFILCVAAVVAVTGVVAVGFRGTEHAGAVATSAPAASQPQPEPTVQVGTQAPAEREVAETLTAFGEVLPGRLEALSFARAGQVTRLDVMAGDHVAKGTPLATLALDPAASEAYTQAGSALGLARREADRLHQLLGLQLATRSQVDVAEKAVLDAAGALRALNAQGGGAGSSTLKAPFDAVVASLAVAQGDRVAAGAPVLQLGRSGALRVQVGVEPAQRRRVGAGTPVSILPVAPPAEARAVETSVASVQVNVDPKTQLVNAIVDLPTSAGDVLLPGMKVRAVLRLGSRRAVTLPRDAVLSDDQGDHIFQVVSGRARRVGVVKLREADGAVAVTGLTDRVSPVVVVGNYELHDGMAVREAPR